MSNQFLAVGTDGNLVSRDPTDSLGVVPIITAHYLSFEDMSWDDIERVSNRASIHSSYYSPRLGESKSIILEDGSTVIANLVGLRKSYLKAGKALGFTFQIVEGLSKSKWSDSLAEDIYQKLPEDLKKVIKTTNDGDIWLPKKGNIVGPIANFWYDYYMYHNESKYRVATDINGEPVGYWTSTFDSNGRYVIGSDGLGTYEDSEDGIYAVSACFSV